MWYQKEESFWKINMLRNLYNINVYTTFNVLCAVAHNTLFLQSYRKALMEVSVQVVKT